MVSKRFDPAWYDEPARRMAEGLVEEERGILTEKRKLEDCDCKEGMFPTSGRRALLRSAIALAGAAPVAFLARGAGADAPPGAVEYDVPDNPTKVQGRLTGDDGGDWESPRTPR
jgi:sulfane dehydrogenase subunit SoxC